MARTPYSSPLEYATPVSVIEDFAFFSGTVKVWQTAVNITGKGFFFGVSLFIFYQGTVTTDLRVDLRITIDGTVVHTSDTMGFVQIDTADESYGQNSINSIFKFNSSLKIEFMHKQTDVDAFLSLIANYSTY